MPLSLKYIYLPPALTVTNFFLSSANCRRQIKKNRRDRYKDKFKDIDAYNNFCYRAIFIIRQ
jgi:hypothetical protein